MKLAFPVKIHTEILFFFFIKAPHVRNIMQSSSPFIRISGPISEERKSVLISDYENNFKYLKELGRSKL